MRGVWMLVHVLGFTLWLGCGIATMVAGVTAKRMAPAERLAGYKLIGAVQRHDVGHDPPDERQGLVRFGESEILAGHGH